MKKKMVVICISIILVGILGVYGIYNRERIRLGIALWDYCKMLEEPLPDDLTLTIYYMDPTVYTAFSIRPEYWAESDEERIVISSEELGSNVDLLKKLDSSLLVPAEKKYGMNARMYYVFESPDTGKILEVSFYGTIDGNVIVNGIEVECDPVFYEIIKPFMTEDLIEKWSEVIAVQTSQN